MEVAAAMPKVAVSNRNINLLNNWSKSYQQYPDIKNNINFIGKVERYFETKVNNLLNIEIHL